MKKKKVSYRSPTGAESPEAKAFEQFAKRVLIVPKEELDRREIEDRKKGAGN